MEKSPFNFVGEMSELERKFIIMSRIAVALNRKGLIVSVTIIDDFCSINVQASDNTCIEDIRSFETTESELLDWWSEIEKCVE